MKSGHFLLFAFSLLSFCLHSQIRNIEELRIWSGDSPWLINSGLNFSYTNNDGNYVYELGARAGTLFKYKDKSGELNNKWLLHGNYSLVRSEREDFSNNWFVHLRFNKEITDFFRVESFIQSQENQLLSIRSRNLIGAGIRLKPIEDFKDTSKRNLHLYIGLAYMYEEEKSRELDLNFYNHRASSYITAGFQFGKDGHKLEIINTLYYQPLLSDFQNFRLSEEFSISFPISDDVGFQTTFNYFLNNKTPAGDVEYRSYIGMGFNYSFKSNPPKLKINGGKRL